MQAQGSNSPGHVTTEPTIHDVNVAVDADPKCVQAPVSYMRARAVEVLGRLAQTNLILRRGFYWFLPLPINSKREMRGEVLE